MGLILVFDLDYTIIDTSLYSDLGPNSDMSLEKIIEGLNPHVLHILNRAARARYAGVDAICLLTNNDSKEFVSAVDNAILQISKKRGGKRGKYNTTECHDTDMAGMTNPEYFFDSILMRSHPNRSAGGIKSLT